MDETLAEWRLQSAKASGGTSNSGIRNLVLKLIRQEQLKGSVLDFGAGKGDLVKELVHLDGVEKVSAADIMERPADLPPHVTWYQQDLNNDSTIAERFDGVICTEVIEHLENPRAVFRNLGKLLKPGGGLILTMPNQESLRSYVALMFGGHFNHFRGNLYPAHITALLRLDLARIAGETGFGPCSFFYTDVGGIPKLSRITWQQVSFGLLCGRLFSDNIGMIARKGDSSPP